MALPSLLEYNSSAGEVAFMPFPGAENISVQLLRGRNNDRFVPTKLAQSLTPEQAWQYWEEKRKAEDQLKKAIMRNELPKNLAPYFNSYRKYTEVEISEVLQLNHDFFRAMSEADISAMKSLWAESPETLFQMADSTDFISGYDNIITYLSKTLEKISTINLTNATVHFMGDVAIVTSEIKTVKLIESKKKQRRAGPISGGGFGGVNVISSGNAIFKIGNNGEIISSGGPQQQQGRRGGRDNKKFRKAYAYVYNIFRRSPLTQRYQLLMHYGTIVDPLEPNTASLYRDPTSPYLPAKSSAMNPLQSLLFGGMMSPEGDDDSDDDDDDDDQDETAEDDDEDDDEDEDEEYDDDEEEEEEEDEDDITMEYDDDDEDDDDDEEDEDDDQDQEIINQIEAIRNDGNFNSDEKRLLDSFRNYAKENQRKRKVSSNNNNNKRKEKVPKDDFRKSLINYDQDGRPVGGVLIIKGSRKPGAPNNVVDRIKQFMGAIREAKVDISQNKGGSSNDNNSNDSNNRRRVGGIRAVDDNSKQDKDSENHDILGLLASRSTEQASLSWRAIASVRWLHSQGRLSDLEKQVLTTSVIDNKQKKPSKLEIAHALLFFELDLTKSKYHNVKDAFAKIEPEDIADFETVCHAIAEELTQQEQPLRSLSLIKKETSSEKLPSTSTPPVPASVSAIASKSVGYLRRKLGLGVKSESVGRPTDFKSALTLTTSGTPKELEMRQLVALALVRLLPDKDFARPFEAMLPQKIRAKVQREAEREVFALGLNPEIIEAYADLTNALVVSLVDRAVNLERGERLEMVLAVEQLIDFSEAAGRAFDRALKALGSKASIEPLVYNGKSSANQLESLYGRYLKWCRDQEDMFGARENEGKAQRPQFAKQQERLGKLQFLFGIKEDKRAKIEEIVSTYLSARTRIAGGQDMQSVINNLLEGKGVEGLDPQALAEMGIPANIGDMSPEEMAEFGRQALTKAKKMLDTGNMSVADVLDFEKILGQTCEEVVTDFERARHDPRAKADMFEEMVGSESDLADLEYIFKQFAAIKKKGSKGGK